MPEGIRYLSSSLPASRRRGVTTEELAQDLDALREESSERFRSMYVEEGAGDSDTAISGSSLTFSMIHIRLTGDVVVSEAYLASAGFPEASGSGILFIAFEQDADANGVGGGHKVSWFPLEFVGAGSFDDEQWHVDTRPGRVTVFVFVRNPHETLGRWWLVGCLPSYDAPEYVAV